MAMEKILIVDDEPNICEVLRTILVKEGYTAITATDGEEALAKFSSMHPDLVLLDVMMPGMNGYTVMREIQKRSNVPVILVTAKSEPNDEALGLDLGAAEDVIGIEALEDEELPVLLLAKIVVSGRPDLGLVPEEVLPAVGHAVGIGVVHRRVHAVLLALPARLWAPEVEVKAIGFGPVSIVLRLEGRLVRVRLGRAEAHVA